MFLEVKSKWIQILSGFGGVHHHSIIQESEAKHHRFEIILYYKVKSWHIITHSIHLFMQCYYPIMFPHALSKANFFLMIMYKYLKIEMERNANLPKDYFNFPACQFLQKETNITFSNILYICNTLNTAVNYRPSTFLIIMIFFSEMKLFLIWGILRL